MDITIPNIGDIDDVEVIELCVAVGDTVAVDDAVVVIESDKASMEIPSPVAGVIESFAVGIGDRVAEGHVIASIAASASEATPSAEPTAGDAAATKTDAPTGADAGTEDKADQDKATPAAVTESEAATELEVLVPDIGDADGVVVIEVAVSEGDVVAAGDLLVVLESDKASMEIAAEHPGNVVKVAVTVDQEVAQGTHIVTLQVATTPTAVTPAAVAQDTQITKAQAPTPSANQLPVATPATPATNEDVLAAAKVYAGPAVRRLARELGVQLTGVVGSGNRGRITKDDVKGFVKKQLQQPQANAGIPAVPSVDFAKFGDVENIDLTRIQQRGAENLHRSWINLPHVTQHDEADITDLEEFRQSLKQEAERKGVRVTPLSFLVKACCHALAEFPRFNSSLHADAKQLVLKKYVNIGMAVDTPEGLVVPVIRDANTKSIWQLSAEIAELSEKARSKKLSIDDLQGGTFSVSSLGALGGTGFTPIVNAPEVAILGVAKLQTKPLWDGQEFQPRKVLPLSLSYDHRVIDGADAVRFTTRLKSVLSDIRLLAL